MKQWVPWLLWGWVCCLSGLGCAQLMEARTVAKFAAAIEQKDTETLKAVSTDSFRQKALRHEKAVDAFDILHLPRGKVTVVKIDEEDENHRKVVVEVGERKRRLQFDLVRDEKTGQWLVNDIRTPQKRNGLVVARSVTEQMDLLITVREFLDAWQDGNRPAILQTSTTELAGVLKELSPSALQQLRTRLTRNASAENYRPKATLDGNAAIVSLQRPQGKMLMKLSQQNGKWKVDDVAFSFAGKENAIASLKKYAVVVHQAQEFLSAYSAGKRKELARLCTGKLYRESLDFANLADFPLQVSQADHQKATVTLKDDQADYVVPSGHSMVRIAMREQTGDGETSPSVPKFLVEDVSLYRTDRKQEVRISSFFVSRAWVKLFAEALRSGDLTILKKASTVDFRTRVWDETDEKLLEHLPLQNVRTGSVIIEATDFHGPVTEVHARQGDNDVTYLLREQGGKVRVDDVLVLRFGQPRSLKSVLELAVPIAKFSRGLVTGDISLLQRVSSRDMNRLIWKQTRQVPRSAAVVPRHLSLPLAGVQPDGEDRIVRFGDENYGARVLMVQEGSRYVVDDILLITGPLPQQRANLKHHLRLELAGSRQTGNNTPVISMRGNRSPADISPADVSRSVSSGKNGRSTSDGNLSDGNFSLRGDFSSRQPVMVDPDGTAFRDELPPQSLPSQRGGRTFSYGQTERSVLPSSPLPAVR